MPETRSIILSIITIFCIALISGNIFGYFMITNMTDVDGFSSLGRQFATYGDLNGSIRRAPIYPVFLGCIYRIFGENRTNVIFFQAVILGILGVCVFIMSYENFQSTKIAFLTGICTVLHPICLWYVPRFWIELLFANLILLMIWSAYKALSASTVWNLIKFGVFAGIASLCKAIILLFPLFLAASVFGLCLFGIKPFKYMNKVILLKIIVIPTSVMFITIFPWVIRNHIVANTWTLISSNVGVEFFRGNVFAEQNSFLLQKTIPEIWDVAQQKERQILSQRGIEANDPTKKKDEIFDSIMKDFIIYHPIEFFIKILKQIPAFWMRGETTKTSIVFMSLALTTLYFFIKGFVAH